MRAESWETGVWERGRSRPGPTGDSVAGSRTICGWRAGAPDGVGHALPHRADVPLIFPLPVGQGRGRDRPCAERPGWRVCLEANADSQHFGDPLLTPTAGDREDGELSGH